MKILMLRGQIPQDRNPQEIVFDNIDEVDDMWTQLIYSMTGYEDETELWYWGGKREKKFDYNFTERWVPSFKIYKSDFVPDVIFCRGGFNEYHCVLKRFPKAFSIYYGAGARYLPQPGFTNYSLVLQDSNEQLKECKKRFPKSHSELFIKPASDNLFCNIDQLEKYDICFPANGNNLFKGHKFIYSTLPKKYSVLNLGMKWRGKTPHNVKSYRVLRPQMVFNITLCKMGIVACLKGGKDSCPRVIPELLSCGLPIVVLDETKFWTEKYITKKTGRIANRKNFWKVVNEVLNNLDSFDVRRYYEENLSLEIAAKYINNLINKLI